jgi:Uma2 family endonuclease
MPSSRTITDDELLRLPKDGKYELVDGEIVMSPAGYRHGKIALRLIRKLEEYARPRGLGELTESSTGFRLPSGNLRCPDVAFVTVSRAPTGEPEGFFEGAPDLAVEVLSPGDDMRRLLDKVGEYLSAGARIVWVIDPRQRSAAVYRSLTNVRRVAESDLLEGEDILPGFACTLASVLDPER